MRFIFIVLKNKANKYIYNNRIHLYFNYICVLTFNHTNISKRSNSLYKILAFENGQPIILYIENEKVYMYTAARGKLFQEDFYLMMLEEILTFFL